ncbi:MAG: single-stranded-DNA-specific exonuclease RecJ [Oligoflexia bacterium]|nr:single-stranded-DNA-specific exonuclease RecJ [Oligoflexia bacterium]
MSWQTKNLFSFSDELLSSVQKKWNIPQWLAQLLLSRLGLENPSLAHIDQYLQSSLKDLPDPFLLPDMDQASERLCQAIVEQEKIGIYGDYDVDGTVGSALFYRFLRALRIEPVVYQPDRHTEGYGVNKNAIRKLAEQGIQLLITIDCGITNIEEVELSNELGMDVIICDHHEPKEILPPAYAVLDHKRKDNDSNIDSLSGAGVGFYLAIATRSMLRDIGFFEENEIAEPNLTALLDLVAIAAVADLVPLIGENRILVKAGLDRLNKDPNLGIRELLNVSGCKLGELGTYHIGFILGPRINASGRLGTANAALKLLITDKLDEAKKLAEKLNQLNSERIDLQSQVASEAIEQAEGYLKDRADNEAAALVVYSDHWHEGVIGIVASRLVEKFGRPAIVITFDTKDKNGKGSVRGISGLDMTELLQENASLLMGFGGHKVAAGLSIMRENIENFQKAFSESVYRKALSLFPEGHGLIKREISIDVNLTSDTEISHEMIKVLEKMAPFGMGNPEPVFRISGWKINGVKTLKERHLKIQLSSAQNRSMEGFWANGVDSYAFTEGESVDLACFPQLNTFRNLNRIEFKIKDIRSANETT